MFTGLVEKTACLKALNENAEKMTEFVFSVEGPYETNLGDSVAVNGCCLTVTQNDNGLLHFDVSKETLAKTNLNQLAVGSEVNLERALALGDRLGGHMVSGHVDALATVESVEKDPQGWLVKVKVTKHYAHLIIEKGSITLDGVSLTINHVEDQQEGCIVDLMLIPTTVEETNLKHLKTGLHLNVEFDLVGKYIERITRAHRS